MATWLAPAADLGATDEVAAAGAEDDAPTALAETTAVATVE